MSSEQIGTITLKQRKSNIVLLFFFRESGGVEADVCLEGSDVERHARQTSKKPKGYLCVSLFSYLYTHHTHVLSLHPTYILGRWNLVRKLTV